MKLSNEVLLPLLRRLRDRCDAGLIPEGLMDGLVRYLACGIRPGGFLSCVLKNDLCGAIGCADATNLARIKDTVCTLMNDLPSGVWGSTNNFEAHIKANKTKVDATATEE